MSDFIAAHPSGPLIWLSKLFWPIVIRLRHHVVCVKAVADGLQKFRKLRGSRVVICPNHPTASDADIMFSFSRLVKENFHYLAAREVFRPHHGAHGFFLSRGGCFSIRRGIGDRASCRAVTKDLTNSRAKMVIFPEGELSHVFDELMPLEPGAAQLGFWALEELEKTAKGENLFMVPVAVSYAYAEDPRYFFDFAFDKLEESLALAPAVEATHQDRLKQVSEHLLKVLEKSYDFHCQGNSLDSRLAVVRRSILTRLAVMLGCETTENEIDLVHCLRDRLDHLQVAAKGECSYAERISQEKALLASLLTRDLHRVLNLRFCLGKCTGDYAYQEIGEALSLLEYEVLGEALPSAKRIALIMVGDAINLQTRLAVYEQDRHSTLQQVTNEIAGQLKSMQADLLTEIKRLESVLIDPKGWSTYHRCEAAEQLCVAHNSEQQEKCKESYLPEGNSIERMRVDVGIARRHASPPQS